MSCETTASGRSRRAASTSREDSEGLKDPWSPASLESVHMSPDLHKGDPMGLRIRCAS